MNIFKELGFTGREAELLHDNAELRITVEQQAAEIERLKAEIEGIYEDSAGEDI